MQTFSIVLEQLIQFGIILIIGMVLAKTEVIHEKFLSEFS